MMILFYLEIDQNYCKKNSYEKPIRETKYFSVEEYEIFQITKGHSDDVKVHEAIQGSQSDIVEKIPRMKKKRTRKRKNAWENFEQLFA